MTLRPLSRVLAALVLGLCSSAVQALPIKWDFVAVAAAGFDIIGSFVYDADLAMFSTVSVASGGALFDFATVSASDTFLSFISGLGPDLTGESVLRLTLLAPMTNAGGSIAFDSGGLLGGSLDSDCRTIAAPLFSNPPTGSIEGATVPVPEPTTIAVFRPFVRAPPHQQLPGREQPG